MIIINNQLNIFGKMPHRYKNELEEIAANSQVPKFCVCVSYQKFSSWSRAYCTSAMLHDKNKRQIIFVNNESLAAKWTIENLCSWPRRFRERCMDKTDVKWRILHSTLYPATTIHYGSSHYHWRKHHEYRFKTRVFTWITISHFVLWLLPRPINSN